MLCKVLGCLPGDGLSGASGWVVVSRPAVKEQLLFYEQIFGTDGCDATRSYKFGKGGEQVKNQ
jgi:hypothetical protein